MKTQEQIISKLEFMRDRSAGNLKAFSEFISTENPIFNPAVVFSECDSTFLEAAEYEFSTAWLRFFNDFDSNRHKRSFEQIILEDVHRHVTSSSQRISNLTSSMTANYMDACRLQTASRFLHWLGGEY